MRLIRRGLLVQVGSQLDQRVELAGRLRELVVELGKLLFLDGSSR